MVLLGEATAIAAGCGFAAGWLVKICRPQRDGPVCPEPSQPAAVQSSVRGQYNVFISHAGPQKNFALWIRSHVRICGYRAFVDERDLRCGSCTSLPGCSLAVGRCVCADVSLACVVVSTPCPAHSQDPLIGLSVDGIKDSTLTKLLRQHHGAASTVNHTQWVNALLNLKKLTGLRQDSTARCERLTRLRASDMQDC